MKFGLNLPTFDALADPSVLAALATEAEHSGWDGLFLWDHIYYRPPVSAATDVWIALAAVAVATTSIKLGPMVTPLARRRPQVVARQVVALDLLSGGRLVLGVGLGLDDSGGEFSRFGEEVVPRRRAARYDEALSLVEALTSGRAVDHCGEFFTAKDVQFLPTPVHGRVPVWVGARWPNRRPVERAVKRDGLFVIDIQPSELPELRALINERRAAGSESFDIVVQSPDPKDAARWEAAGATWWLASFDPFAVTPSVVRDVIRRHPRTDGGRHR